MKALGPFGDVMVYSIDEAFVDLSPVKQGSGTAARGTCVRRCGGGRGFRCQWGSGKTATTISTLGDVLYVMC